MSEKKHVLTSYEETRIFACTEMRRREEKSEMNKVILMGRLTRDPEIRYSQGDNPIAIARYSLAVNRRFKREGEEQTADFINCVVFGKGAEFAENYLKQGTKIVVCGRIQTGSYTNKEGKKVYTTEVVVEEHEFAESKNATGSHGGHAGADSIPEDEFINIPEDLEEDLPFN